MASVPTPHPITKGSSLHPQQQPPAHSPSEGITKPQQQPPGLPPFEFTFFTAFPQAPPLTLTSEISRGQGGTSPDGQVDRATPRVVGQVLPRSYSLSHPEHWGQATLWRPFSHGFGGGQGKLSGHKACMAVSLNKGPYCTVFFHRNGSGRQRGGESAERGDEGAQRCPIPTIEKLHL